MDYRQMIREQLGEGWRFIKAYNAFENGELRIIAADETGSTAAFWSTGS